MFWLYSITTQQTLTNGNYHFPTTVYDFLIKQLCCQIGRHYYHLIDNIIGTLYSECVEIDQLLVNVLNFLLLILLYLIISCGINCSNPSSKNLTSKFLTRIWRDAIGEKRVFLKESSIRILRLQIRFLHCAVPSCIVFSNCFAQLMVYWTRRGRQLI